MFPFTRLSALVTAVLFSLICSATVVSGQSLNSIWSGGTGNWTDGSRWSTSPQFPNTQVDSASISDGTVTLDQNIGIDQLTLGSLAGGVATLDLASSTLTVQNLTFRRGAVVGAGTLDINGPFVWNDMYMQGSGTINANQGVFFYNDQPSPIGFGRLYGTLNCYGSSSVQVSGAYSENLDFGSAAAINIMPGAQFNGSRLMILGSDTFGVVSGTVTNYGSIVVDDPGLNRGFYIFGTEFVNFGAIQVANSALDVRTTVDQPAFVQNGGSITITNGEFFVSGIARLNAGLLTGFGQVTNIENDATIAPTFPGFDFQQGTLTLLPNSVLAFDLNTTRSVVLCPQISNISRAVLDGTLQITVSKTAQKRIRPFTTFTLVAAQSISGQFKNVSSGQRLDTADGHGSFLVTYDGFNVQLSQFKRQRRGGRR